MVKPAEMLEGYRLPDGWLVMERLKRDPNATGGQFSIPYLVERQREDGRNEIAFLKALDFSGAPEAAAIAGCDIADILKSMLDAFVHERDLVQMCTAGRMRNVIAGLGSGSCELDDDSIDPFLRNISYLILERADGDIRGMLDADVDRALDEV